MTTLAEKSLLIHDPDYILSNQVTNFMYKTGNKTP